MEALHYFFIVGPIIGLLFVCFWIQYSYKKILLMKAENQEVEFILNQPIVLIKEEDYIKLKVGRRVNHES
jgi:hypothetical protein